MKTYVYLIFLCLIILLAACSTKKDEPRLVHHIKSDNQHEVNIDVENWLHDNDKIKETFIIENEKDVLVAIQMNHFSRFQRNGLEKKWQKALAKLFNNKDVTVSTDFKILYELEQWQEKHHQDFSSHMINDKLESLIQLLKEET